MIEIIDKKIKRLLEIRDSRAIRANSELRGTICGVIEKDYLQEKRILLNKKINEPIDNQFYVSFSSVNRFFRDWNLDEVADIYIELHEISKNYILRSE